MTDSNGREDSRTERPSFASELLRALASTAVSMAALIVGALLFKSLEHAAPPWSQLAPVIAGVAYAGFATAGGLIVLAQPSPATRRRVLSRVLIIASLVLLAANQVEASTRLLALGSVAMVSYGIVAWSDRRDATGTAL